MTARALARRRLLSPRGACIALTTSLATLVAAKAGATPAIVLPTMTPVADCTACPTLHRPDPEAERHLASLGRELDSVVVEAAQDLGLTIDVTARPALATEAPVSEHAIVEQAATSWVFSPRIGLEGSAIIVRIVAVQPGSHVLLVRTEQIKPDELDVRAVLMMRDLVRAAGVKGGPPAPTPQANESAVVKPARSPGRAVLAFNAAVFGGYIGFALQSAGGSNDPRLTYPLIALGTGIGLGGAVLASEEWDISVGDAWYLSAGTWWPALGALLIASEEPSSKRYLYSAAAAGGGLALSTTAIAFGSMSEGDALVAHSGGAFGLGLGGVTDLAIQGRTDVTPTLGLGVGAIVGVVAAGALARFTPSQPPSRVLFVDLSAGLGGLGAAAVASPLVFGTDVSATRNRLWLSSIIVGTFAGATVGILMTQSTPPEPKKRASMTSVSPFVGVIAEETLPGGRSSPVTGAGITGTW